MEETISLKELLQTLKNRLTLIISVTLIAVMISGVVSYFFLTPIYEATTQILVNKTNNDQGLYNSNEVQTNLQLINTYNVIIKSPAILDKVNDELDLNMTTSALNEKITVQSAQNSQVLTISVDDPNASNAAKVANKTAQVFKKQIVKIMKVDNVSILAKAKVIDGQSPIKPRPLLNVAIALVVGLMAGAGLAFLLEYFNNTIKTEQDVEKILELPVLGVITNIGETKTSDKNVTRNRRMRGETFGS